MTFCQHCAKEGATFEAYFIDYTKLGISLLGSQELYLSLFCDKNCLNGYVDLRRHRNGF